MSDRVDETTTPAAESSSAAQAAPPSGRRRRHYAATLVAGLAVLAIGAAGGAGAMRLMRPAPEMAPINPVAISSMPQWSLVTIRGKVAEIYGNKFIVQDDTGRALVETGPAGEDGDLVKKDEAVTIQGRFNDGTVHASYLVHQNGATVALGPAGGPPPPPHRGLAGLFHKID
ncbi:hypothetical protein [Oryzifoliimicrobium ureilyticus]|uniref:hypothetical protein n=1 Tax=Oryzifoliimicrobium ureilyticus TaxID=3113724 RepID=UPI0030760FEC